MQHNSLKLSFFSGVAVSASTSLLATIGDSRNSLLRAVATLFFFVAALLLFSAAEVASESRAAQRLTHDQPGTRGQDILGVGWRIAVGGLSGVAGLAALLAEALVSS